MNKLRWMQADLGIPLDALALRLKRTTLDLSQDDASGFRLLESSPDFLSAQFIERAIFLETIVLPTGDEYQERRSRVSIAEFKLQFGSPLSFMLINPPRRIDGLLTALSVASDYSLYFSSLEVDVLDWIAQFEAVNGSLNVGYMDCSHIPLGGSVTGRFAVRGHEDVRAQMQKLLGKRKPIVESARCSTAWGGAPVSIEFCRAGVFKVGAGGSRSLSEAAEGALATAARISQ